jgi:hypothetical protein
MMLSGVPEALEKLIFCGWVVAVTPTLPSGKHTKNYGKSPFLMGKSTINGY